MRDASTRGIVIGHDHRHNSERWSKLTATVFASKRVKVYLHRGLVHTPLVPFSVKRLNAACGVMITGELVIISQHRSADVFQRATIQRYVHRCQVAWTSPLLTPFPQEDNGYKVIRIFARECRTISTTLLDL